jgi:hypothetical protein
MGAGFRHSLRDDESVMNQGFSGCCFAEILLIKDNAIYGDMMEWINMHLKRDREA